VVKREKKCEKNKSRRRSWVPDRGTWKRGYIRTLQVSPQEWQAWNSPWWGNKEQSKNPHKHQTVAGKESLRKGYGKGIKDIR